MGQVFSGGDVSPAAEIGDALANPLDADSGAAAKRGFRVQTLGGSNDIVVIAKAIAAQHTLTQSADIDGLDGFALLHQMGGHRETMFGASTIYPVPQVVGTLWPEVAAQGTE